MKAAILVKCHFRESLKIIPLISSAETTMDKGVQ